MVKPHKPSTTPSRGESTSTSQLEVIYPMLLNEETGGSAITSLLLEWDRGTDGQTWETLIGESPLQTTDSYIINQNVEEGRVYLFRYRARNVFGLGPLSEVAFV